MNHDLSTHPGSKPLPPPIREDKLPPLPPLDDSWSSHPPPPPKGRHDQDNTHRTLAPVNTSASLSPRDAEGFSAPLTPVSPGGMNPSVPPSPSADGKSKKSNPLTDLIETEKVYVDLLTGIIRKVAAAWSRSNLPPPELDTLFRSIEGIYRANRSLLGKLKEIGLNPSSPKALGDLLMRWIDDLEQPYTTYCSLYCAGFDTWEPVQSNPRLRTTLAVFSSSNPPPLSPTSPEHPVEPPLWTLDELFILPKGRLRYYRKLYSRLLRSTTPGRSDHRLLTGAINKLDGLLATLDGRASVNVGSLAQAQETEDEVVIDLRSRDSTGRALQLDAGGPFPQRASDSTGAGGSAHSRERLSQDTPPTSEEQSAPPALRASITDLERRLTTERTLDIFTMQPKQVRLQISPPSLPYTRELRISADVTINLIPRATGVEVVQRRGHVLILTDLLLICDKMTQDEVAQRGPNGPDMWLTYPPLAGKHLRVSPVVEIDTALTVTILRKEALTLYAASPQLRDRLVAAFRECIDAGALLIPSKGQNPPPPVPSLPSMTGPTNPPPAQMEQRASNGMPSAHSSGSTSPPTRALSPGSMSSHHSNDRVQSPPVAPSIDDGMSRLALGQGPGQMFPPRSSSTAPNGPGPSFAPGQFVPGPGYGPGQVMPPGSFAPGQVMPPGPPGPGQRMPPGPGQMMPPLASRPPRGASFNVGPSEPPQGRLPPGPGYPGQPPRNGPPSGPGYPGPSPHNGPPPGPGYPGPSQFGGPPNAPFNRQDMFRQGSPAPSASRPPSDGSYGGSIRKTPSSRSLASQYEHLPPGAAPPMPAYPEGLPPPPRPGFMRTGSSSSLNSLAAPRPLLPSAQISMRSVSTAGSFMDPSPPNSPVEETPQHIGPVTSVITAQMKCKVFLKQQHAQWKSLGSAKLKLYHESPTNVKQLVVESDNSKHTVIISTIVLADGVERVGKTGVAIELSDKGLRTGIVYMIQLRNEDSTQGLFDSLLKGSDRSGVNG